MIMLVIKNTILVYDSFNEIFDLSKSNEFAKRVVQAWADGLWFTSKPDVPDTIKLTVYKVSGEINTDDL